MKIERSLAARSAPFRLTSRHIPAGDQISAIEQLIMGLESKRRDQVLLGVTGSGKTFTMANIINNLQRPAIIMAHNKTLAAQLYSEMKGFFPDNAVEYFVSYYDYYQPESYLPKSDMYIEKESMINDQIDLMRHSATSTLINRRDVIIVTSVSGIYGLGSPEIYSKMIIYIEQGAKCCREKMIYDLVRLQYKRNDIELSRGTFNVRGDVVNIFPSYANELALCVEFCDENIEKIFEYDSLTRNKINTLKDVTIYANTHFATPIEIVRQATTEIMKELEDRVKVLQSEGKIVEAKRLEQRTLYDIEMMLEIGSCNGIENYSRYLDGRKAGEPPATLFNYLAEDALLFVDESHVSIPQIRAMHAGDRSRKNTLIEHGFRLPSSLDNRPLHFDEWNVIRPQTIYFSATPGAYELSLTNNCAVEQIIRPTGLIDPICEIRSAKNQVDDAINEIRATINNGMRVIVITLTKKMAENLNDYFRDIGIKATYIHSDIDTLERIHILQIFRSGAIDVLIGINLLREGIDIPECGLVTIMDADKEGFLRSATALIQIIGRAARNSEGRVILYADVITNSMKIALHETNRRREMQHQYNIKHNIVPTTIKKDITEVFNAAIPGKKRKTPSKTKTISITPQNVDRLIMSTKKDMLKAAADLKFEDAASLRDKLHKLYEYKMGVNSEDLSNVQNI